MSVIDKFLDVMKLGGDEEYDDYDDDYDYEDEYEEKPKKSLFKKKKNEEPEDDFEPVSGSSARAAKVTPIRQAQRKSSNGMEVCVIKPGSFEDSLEIMDTLLSNRTVVLNFEGLDVDVAQRIIDFTSGGCYAIGGHLQKVSGYIFLVTPKNVDISGDLQDILSGSLDIPSVYNK